MSVLVDLQKRLIPFDSAKRLYEVQHQVAVYPGAQCWHDFLQWWGNAAMDAAEAFVDQSKRRPVEFNMAKEAANGPDLRERVARALAAVKRRRGFLATEIHLVDDLTRACDAFLAVLGMTQAEPVGEWVMVPREPTEAMRATFIAQAGSATHFTHTFLQCADFDSRYRAMLAAAPQPQPQPQAIVDVPNILARTNEKQQVEVYWHGNLFAVIEPVRIAAQQPQASAEDLRAIDVIGKGDMASQAWKRIRADYKRMGVVK